ncbi:glycoside hydrolase family 47 protein [Trichoderma asperellum CBS 433.97]|uniref:alpha-1,2-Mannosidase n=1 Tax=Trichoderma asperellum (strain ATCC 204424 / CBS 433.97 / NBRC 101777) TaxID=1042311 RepID=A0A2T3Z9K5_TRIA4|nr:glycoside hydrolase family 47 protein [Trichoderma asperellum CBS 433.97]PTB41487.1 glycoside hydrolase family 47 protein [Trichoderma asperellum CBS 433.97]
MFAGRPRFIRNGIILTIFLFVLWRFQVTSPSPSTSEWKLLQHRMNHGASPSQLPESKSSFDWGAVKLRFAPNSTTKLPKKSSRPLPRIQHPFGPEPSPAAREREARLLEVKKVALRAWRGYKKHAWMQDALLPISGAGREQFSGWAATLVDSLDTLWIMGLREEFDEAVAAVADIDFGSSTSNRINIFETNIRYLGGLLAAYDLSGRELLLKKAVELGDLIYGGFNTENGMPVDFISFHAAKEGGGLLVEGAVVSASPGTLSLELAHLSQVTGDMKYYSAVAQLMDVFYQGQNQTSVPGVWPMNINMNAKDVVQGSSFTLGGCADSLYEYLPKMHQLLGGGEPKYDIMSRTFLKAADQHFLFRPMLPDEDDILISGNVNINSEGKPVLDPETEHLACFVGGMFGLAGRLFGNEGDVERGIKLTNGCVYAYRAFPTGMMPERIDFAPCKDRAHCPWDEEYWIQERDKRNEWREHLPKGFTTAKDPRYLLRPEAIESVFYAYRLTGRKEFQDAAWDMFTAIAKATKTEYANAAVLDVTTRAEKPPQEDYMESFWLAETLKYFYLVFSTPDIISLDDYVLNTEAHPFKLTK